MLKTGNSRFTILFVVCALCSLDVFCRTYMADEPLVDLEPGSYVKKWLVECKLGEGGFGAVYKVSPA